MSKFKVLDDGLIVDKISKSYGNKEVIRDITISIKRGKIVFIRTKWPEKQQVFM